MAGYDSIKSVAKVLVVLLGLTVALDLLSIVFAVGQHGLLDRAANGLMTPEEADANDKRIQVVIIVQLVVLLVTAGTFVTWMAKAHRNLRAFGTPFFYSPAQVGWAFFIPFVNLVRPYRIVKGIWEASVPVDDALIGKSTQILSIWWGLWIVQSLFGRTASAMQKATTIEGLQSANTVTIVGTAINLAAAVAAILVVQGLTQRQESCASGQVAEEFD